MKLIESIKKSKQYDDEVYFHCANLVPAEYFKYKKLKFLVNKVCFWVFFTILTLCYYAFLFICVLNGIITLP